MGDYISELPDDILSHIISLLTVRESVRTRCLSHRWKHVVDCRTILRFNSQTVFGKDQWYCKKEFVTAVDQFLNSWGAQIISKFHLKSGLTNEFSPYIDKWIDDAISKGVETLHLNLRYFIVASENIRYTLPFHRWHSEEEASSSSSSSSSSSLSSLRHLSLKFCSISLCTGCKSWLSSLTTLKLKMTTLHKSDINHILFGAVNLTSLTLDLCVVTHEQINVHLPHLKNLVIRHSSANVDLNCPYLESLSYGNDSCITFSCHLPFLRRANLVLIDKGRMGCSCEEVDHLTTYAPMIQNLHLLVISEVPPQLPSISMDSLKRLHLRLKIPFDFDLFTLMDMLHLFPSLESFHLEVNYYYRIFKRRPKTQYPDRPHRCLKEFKFENYSEVLQQMEFAQYLLKNAAALEQMIIVAQHKSRWNVEPKFNLLHGIHPSADIIISGGMEYIHLQNQSPAVGDVY